MPKGTQTPHKPNSKSSGKPATKPAAKPAGKSNSSATTQSSSVKKPARGRYTIDR